MRWILELLVSGLIFSNVACSTLLEVDSTPSKDIKPAGADQQKKLQNLKKQLKSGKPDDNIVLLNREKPTYRGSDFEPEVERLLAQEYTKLLKHTDAGLAYLRAARSSRAGDHQFKLCQLAGKSFRLASDWERISKGADFCLANFELSKENIRDLKDLKVRAMEASGINSLDVAKSYVELTASSQGEMEALYRAKALQLVQSMNTQQLDTVINDSEFGFLRGHAAFRLGQIYSSQRDASSAKKAYSKVPQFLPETELAEQALSRINQVERINQVNPSTLGVVLPLSGKHSSLGQKVLRGLQIGLGLDGQGPSPLRLAIIDSEGNPDLARRGVEKLVQDDNVIAIVGSLLSKTANAVADQAQVLGVPNLALSQKSGITLVGDNVYRLGTTSEMQVQYLVQRCMKVMGFRRFAIIYPNDKFGVEYANLFWDEVLARGGEIRAAQSYDPEEGDFSGLVQRLSGSFYQEERQDEIKWASRQQSERNKGMSVRARSDEDLLSPVIDFDAVFIADGIKALGQISAMLAYHGVKGTKLIGLNLWNNDSIIKRLANSGNQVLFVDGLALNQKTLEAHPFFKKYKENFNEIPGAFEVQGYETALLLLQVLSENVQTREDFRDRLNKLTSVQGVVGSLVKNEYREFAKPLQLYTIENNQIKATTHY